MKTRIAITALIVLLGIFASGLYGYIHDPLTAATTAAQLDDTLQSYLVAKAVRENFVGHTIIIACAVLILITWVFPAKKRQ